MRVALLSAEEKEGEKDTDLAKWRANVNDAIDCR